MAYVTESLNRKVLAGQGVPLVLLHGWGRSLVSLEPLGELLSACGPVHLLDLPGFGKSPAPAEDWSTEEYACCVLDYLDAAGITKAHFLGHSFGGRISVRIAATNPERVERLILVASHGLKSSKTPRQLMRGIWLGRMSKLCKLIDRTIRSNLFENWFVPQFGSRDYKAAGDLRGTFVRVVKEDLASLAAGIKAPTLLLYGDRDTETPLSMGQQYKSLISGSRLIELRGHGHHPFEDVGSHLLVHYCEPFLKQGGTKGALAEVAQDGSSDLGELANG